MTVPASRGEKSTVLLLGAGFSRALSPHMPLTDDLGNAVIHRLGLGADARVPQDGFRNGAFETWLSHLADDQPFLSAQENLENHGLFLRLSEGIAEELGEAVQAVLAEPLPHWVPELIRIAHWERSTVITFNYDTVVECAVAADLLYEWKAYFPVAWTEVTQDVPNWPPGPGRLAAEPAETFKLLKLHGSLNWYWTPGDEVGTSVARRVLPGKVGEPSPYSERDRRRELPGRVPFVVPPSASKSSFYRVPVLRDLWRQASDALREADLVALIGYSLPLTDLTVVDMLSAALGPSSASLVVVDLKPGPVAERLVHLGVSRERITSVEPFGEVSAVESFAMGWVNEVGVSVAARLSATNDDDLDDPLLVVWGKELLSTVIALDPTGGAPVLVIEPPAQEGLATRVSDERKQNRLPTLREALEVRPPNSLLLVRLPDGSHQTVIGHGFAEFGVGYGRGRWHVLYPSGPAPNSRLAYHASF